MIKRAPLTLILAVAVQRSAAPAFPLEEVTAAQLQAWMTSGRYTARQVAELYLRRIDEIDRSGPALRAVIEVNPDALTIADALDADLRAQGPGGPLHGIPVLIKDNVETAAGVMTTTGSLARAGAAPARAPL